jgi:hypothetical protein
MIRVRKMIGMGGTVRATLMNRRWRRRWSIAICGAGNITRLLDSVEPYLILKAREAAVYRTILATYPKVPCNYRISPAVLRRREALWKRMRLLRGRGW